MKKNLLTISLCFCLIISLNGNSQTWSAVGTGVNSNVYAFAVDTINNELYVGGWFLTAGGIPASHIAKWNGTSWASVGGGINNNMSMDIRSLCFYNGELYAAGLFDSAGTVPVNNIAKWDGNNWHEVGSGLNHSVLTLSEYNGELYAGGAFDSSGNVPVNNIARWNGNSWSDVGGGTDYPVYTLCAYNNELYAGGVFLHAGGLNANRVAKWNGAVWDTVGAGFNSYVYKLSVCNNELYAGGEFTPFPGNTSRIISKLAGNNWQSLVNPSGGNAPAVRDLVSYNGNIYITGEFTSPSYIAKFNGNNYYALDVGLSWVGGCLVVFNNELYIGGYFSSAGGLSNTAGLAKWNDAVGIFENIDSGYSVAAPNPFNDETNISIPQNSGVKTPYQLTVYDVLGKLVRQIKIYDSDRYKLERKNLPSGVYYYKLLDKEEKVLARGKITAN